MKRSIRGILLALVAVSLPALAWGPDGHRIVAQIAFDHMTPQAQAAVTAELKAANEPEPTLPGIANWADQVRDPESAPLHYLNMPKGDCHYVAERDCPDGKCVIGGIESSIAVLKDINSPEPRRIVALKNLVHFVGDIHQPLHEGLAIDKGGNTVQLQWAGKGSNLHRVWDSGLITAIDPDWEDFEKKLTDREVKADWIGFSPSGWAEASCVIAQSDGLYPSTTTPGAEYVRRWAPVVEDQLTIAGLRLAAILNRLY
jgi:hypothetical protein